MRVVVDTNVLVSAVFFGGVPGKVLGAWRDSRLELVVSPAILDEYRRVGERLEEQFPGVSLAPFLALVATHAHVVDAPELEDRVTTDPDDDCLFACAVAARCRAIVSGDRGVCAASGYRGIQVMTPRQVVDELG